jgi:hypothetical protein
MSDHARYKVIISYLNKYDYKRQEAEFTLKDYDDNIKITKVRIENGRGEIIFDRKR